MPRIVLASCNLWPEVSEGDRLYLEALRAHGVEVEVAPWNGPQAPFRTADLIVLRSNWDFHYEPAAFALWVEMLARAGARVLNPPDVVLWNVHKRYLHEVERELQRTPAAAGITVPRTVFVDYSPGRIAAAFAGLGGTAAVIKPAIGASGYHVYKVTPATLDEVIERVQAGLPGRPLMVQEFLPEIAEGERSFVFIDGAFSHLLCRQPDTSRRLAYDPDEQEFRANGVHGVTTTLASATAAEIAQVQAVLDAATAIARPPESLLYARVDGVFRAGRFILTELELNEPGLGLNLDPPAAERFAAATLRRLA
jgi:glutathione synthase/RimK-type ligase-like ATP-grasp enzyme